MRIALAQIRPAFLDSGRTTEIILDAIHTAKRQGADLIVFGECALGGYPFWLSQGGGAQFDDAVQKEVYARYLHSTVATDGPEMEAIVQLLRRTGLFAYLGIAERAPRTAAGTIYCSLVAIDPEQGLVSVHRKLMPTFEERLVWGAGDGHGLRVHDHREARLGGLNCWENWMPQARHALYAQGETVHVSVWPGGTALTKDITRFIALEGRVFSIAAGTLFGYDDLPTDFPLREALACHRKSLEYDGGSAVAAPDGRWVREPICGAEGVFIVDIDLRKVSRARQNFDPAGHYSRPDVFAVSVDRRRRRAAHFHDDGFPRDDSET